MNLGMKYKSYSKSTDSFKQKNAINYFSYNCYTVPMIGIANYTLLHKLINSDCKKAEMGYIFSSPIKRSINNKKNTQIK